MGVSIFLFIYSPSYPLRSATGPYLIVGLEKKLVGNIAGHNVYNIIQFDVIPFPKSTIHLSESQVMHLVCACLEDPVLFFALRVCNTYMLVCVWIFPLQLCSLWRRCVTSVSLSPLNRLKITSSMWLWCSVCWPHQGSTSPTPMTSASPSKGDTSCPRPKRTSLSSLSTSEQICALCGILTYCETWW